jgi:hypothetical protein
LSCVTIPDSFGRKEGRRREGSLEDFLLVDIPSRPGESSKGYIDCSSLHLKLLQGLNPNSEYDFNLIKIIAKC